MLQKGLYGLKQAGRIWNKKITKILLESGLKQSHYDPCIFFKATSDGKFMYLLLYVDDILTYTNDEDLANTFLTTCRHHDLDIVELGKPKKTIGIEVFTNSNGLTLKQSGYIHTKLQEFHLIDASERTNPSFANLPTIIEPKAISEYQQLTGSLQYAASGTRPDIAFQVGALSRFNNAPDYPHLKAVKNVLKYLKGTADYGIHYAKGNGRKLRLECFVDADYASNLTDRRSTTGYVIKLAGGPIAWGSRRQTVCAQSSAEAELIALSTVSKLVTWFINLLNEIGIPYLDLPVVIREDNQACIKMASTEGQTNRTKHIDVRYFYIREQIQKGKQKVEYIKSTNNQADILTKNLPTETFIRLREAIGVRSTASGSVEGEEAVGGQQSHRATPDTRV
jgi:hypothetical protein